MLGLVLSLVSLGVLYSPSCLADLEVTRTCEPIRIDTCKDIGYNVTGMPNLVGHDLQQDAQMQLQTFAPLVQYGCSSRLRFFLCSVYVPMCTDKVPQPIGPCRPLCESVQELCEPVLLEFGFLWPPALNCSQFPPVNNEKHMCMEGPDTEEKKRPSHRRPTNPGILRGSGNVVSRPRPHHSASTIRSISRAMCKNLRSPEKYFYINSTNKCAATCNADILYSKENKDFAQVWVAVTASLCFLTTLFTIIAYLTNSKPFRYPEKIIVILSGCYFVYSIGYFVRLVGGREETACYSDPYYGVSLLAQSGLDNINCTLIFMLLYFFSMASSIWWVILALCWFLTAGLGWDPRTLEQKSMYFHVIAWLPPTLKTTAILVMRAVDADELTGTCYVGNQDHQNLVRFVIVPSLTYLVVGIVFLVAGVVAIFRAKNHRPKFTNIDDKWEMLMVRVGIFAILYTIPATCVLGANFYELGTKDEWLAATSMLRPNVEVFILKIFMSLVVGLTSGIWLFTSRSPFHKWGSLQSKFCARQQTVPIYNPPQHVILLDGLPHKIKLKGTVTNI